MGRKLTSNERIGLLLTGILIILACIALAVIPRHGSQVPPSPQLKPAEPPAPSERVEQSAPTHSTHIPPARNPLNEEF